MKKTAVFIACGTGMGADAAKHLSSKGYDIAIMSSSGKGERLANNLGGLGYTGSNLSSNDISAGKIIWSPNHSGGDNISSGVYVIRMTSGLKKAESKIMFIK